MLPPILTTPSLPFLNDNGCGLGIATRTYLDAINKDGTQPTDKFKGQIKAQEDPYTWFQFVSNLSKNLDNAFKLWDAVSGILRPALRAANVARSTPVSRSQAKKSKKLKHSPILMTGFARGASSYRACDHI